MMQVLVQMGVDPKKEDSLKQTPLFYVAREGNNLAIQFLCAEQKVDVDKPDKYGQTALYYAVREGHIDTVKQMISLGANCDHADLKA